VSDICRTCLLIFSKLKTYFFYPVHHIGAEIDEALNWDIKDCCLKKLILWTYAKNQKTFEPDPIDLLLLIPRLLCTKVKRRQNDSYRNGS
jgi:hypothetical protein